MSEHRLSWTQATCERCWLEAEGEWDLEVLPGGETVQVLISVRQPVRLNEPEVERCCWCGAFTIFGVYKRADPASVPYPRYERDE